MSKVAEQIAHGNVDVHPSVEMEHWDPDVSLGIILIRPAYNPSAAASVNFYDPDRLYPDSYNDCHEVKLLFL